MQFEKTQTFKNLARSFAGESQAGMRYQLIAKQAMQEGYKTLADEIRTIAKNETFHAKRFFETLQERRAAARISTSKPAILSMRVRLKKGLPLPQTTKRRKRNSTPNLPKLRKKKALPILRRFTS